MVKGRRKDTWVVPLAVALAVGLLLLDLSLPLGVAAGVPYVAVVILGWWLRRRNGVFLLATLASILTLVGLFLSPGAITLIAVFNRILALLAIWVTAILLTMAKRSELASRSETAITISPCQLSGRTRTTGTRAPGDERKTSFWTCRPRLQPS